MVVGAATNGPAAGGGGTETESGASAPPQQPPLEIDNIMSGIGNTGTVKMNNHRKKLRQRFDIIKKLGQGTYGKVQLGINKETSQEVAIKTIKKCKIETEADLIRIRREVQIMSSVQHPNIIHIYEVFENREKMVLVMEFAAGGELYDYLSERKVLSEDEARRVFRQVATAVYYCHKHKICHRDLKLENILLDEHGNAKIADFGLSNVFDDQRLLATFCGSPLYASPEIVKGTPYQGPEVDCWSLGVLLYTLVYGAMPFDGSNFKRLVKQISQGDYYEPKKPSNASPLIREMLTVCPQRRANIEQICSHWWVNEGYSETCLNLAEELANQTPVRLDVLLSLTPSSVTAEQLVVPNHEESAKPADRIVRSHSVGSISTDLGNTEAEQRIIDMVQAGGEAALMPSPTRTITPSVDSPAQAKRKLETTMSMDMAIGAKKKERADQMKTNMSKHSIAEHMDVVESVEPQLSEPVVEEPTQCDVETIHRGVIELEENMSDAQILPPEAPVPVTPVTLEPVPEPVSPVQEQIELPVNVPEPESPTARKNSLPDDALSQSTERRRSRIFETAEKLQSLSTGQEKPTGKFPSSGAVGTVNNFKKEFERRASLTSTETVPPPTVVPQQQQQQKKSPEKVVNAEVVKPPLPPHQSGPASVQQQQKQIPPPLPPPPQQPVLQEAATPVAEQPTPLQSNESFRSEGSGTTNDSKTSLHNFSLEEARRSMENSIALLNKARNESNPDVDQLCEKTENVSVSAEQEERQRKLKNAREIIGIRKPPVPFGSNGRSISGSVVPPPSSTGSVIKPVRAPEPKQDLPGSGIKTSRAEIVLKSNTLPRRKPGKTEIQLDIKTDPSPVPVSPMRFSTEMQHHVPDLRSAPIAEHSTATPFTPLSMQAQRATSLEPQAKEHFIPIVRPPPAGVPPSMQQRSSTANTFRSSLSRQSTNDSDTETATTTTNATQSTINVGGANQPIKKSPREFIIPIKMEGGGLITPRAGSLEPSESASTFRSSATTLTSGSRPKRLGSLLGDRDQDDDSLFSRMQRHSSLMKDSDMDDVQRFPHSLHRLRTSRPIKKVTTEQNESGSSDEENDDEDGFEILTAEKLFSTLLQRVRALTNRVNVNSGVGSSSGNSSTTAFPSPRLMSSLRHNHTPFWHQHDPFAGSRLSNTATGATGATGSGPWPSQMHRDLSQNLDSMFSHRMSGATLPRVGFRVSLSHAQNPRNTTTTLLHSASPPDEDAKVPQQPQQQQ